MDPRAIELQKEIVVAIAETIDEEWERVVVNYEIEHDDGSLIEDRRGFYISRSGTGFRKGMLTFTEEIKELFRDLSDAMAGSDGSQWGTCDLVIDQPGRFNYQFSYEKPKRINGIFDNESTGRFDRYLETYSAEQPGS